MHNSQSPQAIQNENKILTNIFYTVSMVIRVANFSKYKETLRNIHFIWKQNLVGRTFLSEVICVIRVYDPCSDITKAA